jgi:hypothetical protein
MPILEPPGTTGGLRSSLTKVPGDCRCCLVGKGWKVTHTHLRRQSREVQQTLADLADLI